MKCVSTYNVPCIVSTNLSNVKADTSGPFTAIQTFTFVAGLGLDKRELYVIIYEIYVINIH